MTSMDLGEYYYW